MLGPGRVPSFHRPTDRLVPLQLAGPQNPAGSARAGRGGALAGPAPRRRDQLGPAQADVGRRHLDALVVGEELERLLERQQARRHQPHDSSDPEPRMLVSFFSLVGLTSMSSEREFSPTIMPS